MAYRFKSGSNVYFRVTINRKGHKVDKLFPTMKLAKAFEEITRQAIDDGSYVDEDSKLALIPDITGLLDTYFDFIKDHNTEAVAYKFTIKNKEYKLRKQIPNIIITLPDSNAFHGGDDGMGYRMSEKPIVKVIDENNGVTETYYRFGAFYIDSLDSYIIERYIESRREAGLKEGSINTELSFIKQAIKLSGRLFPTMKSEGILIKNPFDEFLQSQLPKRSPPKKKIVSDEQVRMILEYFGTKDNKEYSLCFKICLLTGIRLNECLSIKVKNIDFDKQTIYLPMTKNGNDRKIPVSDEIIELCKAYQDREDLFLITQYGLHQMWYRARDFYKEKLPDDKRDDFHKNWHGFHCLKNTAISKAVKESSLYHIAERFQVSKAVIEEHLLESKFDEFVRKFRSGEIKTDEEIQKFIAGHKSEKMTQRYYVDEDS